jgi:uncharacterized repeat protein (TIGR01451 family)
MNRSLIHTIDLKNKNNKPIGGFKMKPTRIMIVMAVLLMTVSLSFAAGTPAGTAITNYAVGDFKDLMGNLLPEVTSNTVTTIVSQVAGVDVNPPAAALNLVANSSVSYSILLTNTGNGDDTFSLGAALSGSYVGGYAITIYEDTNGNGVFDTGEPEVNTTGNLVADASLDLVIMVQDTTSGGAPNADRPVVTLTATSGFDGGVTGTGVYTTTVTAASVDITLGATPDDPQPGSVITYSVCLDNSGLDAAYNPVITAVIPDNTTYVPGSIKVGSSSDYALGTPQTDADDLGDEADFNITALNTITVGLSDVTSGGSICLMYQVVINEDVPVGTDISNEVTVTYDNGQDPATPYEPITGGGGGGSIIVAQSYGVQLGVDETALANPGETVLFPLSVQNTGNGSDVINISSSGNFLSWALYRDYNGNHVIDTGDNLLTDTNADGKFDVGSLVSGQLVYIIAKSIVPAGNSNGDQDVTTITGKSGGDLATTPASDTAQITTTVIAPIITMTKTVSPTGDQPPGTILTYRVDVHNLGDGIATDGTISDAIPDNTTYVAGSMKLAGITKTDAADSDQGSFVGNSVVFTIPSLGASGSTYATFQVTID